MKKRARIIIVSVIYILFILSVLFWLNKKRAQEYTYNTDLGFYTVNVGEITSDGTIYIDEGYEYSGEYAFSPGIQLRPGEYDVTVNYHSTGDNKVHLSANANYEEYVTLSAEEQAVTVRAAVYPSSDDFRIWLIYNGAGSLTIDSIVITSDKPLYTDYEYFMILTVLFAILIPAVLYYLAKKKGYTKSDWIRTGILATLSVVVNFPVFYGYLWMGVDMRPHLMRIDGVSMCIEAHRYPTIIYPNYCNGYGELSCIYPDKFLYLAGLLRNRGVSLLATYDTMHFLVNVAALIIMYQCVKYITQKKIPAFIAAVLFTFVPYRLYVVGEGSQTLGNGLAMIFLPLVFTGLYDIFFRKGRRWYLLTVGMAAIACSHILSIALAAIVCVITAVCSLIILIREKKNTPDGDHNNCGNIAKSLLISIGVFIAVTLSMTVPFVYYYSQGLNMGKMSLDFLESINSFSKDFLEENGIFHILALAGVAAMLIVLRKDGFRFKEIYAKFCVFMLAMGFGFFWMSTCLFPWRIFAKIPFIYSKLCMLQFAERFMIVGNTALAMGIGMLFDIFIKNVKVTGLIKGLTIAGLIVSVFLGYRLTVNGIASCEMLIPDRMSGSFYYRQLGYLPPGTEISYYESPTPGLYDWDSVENVSYTKVGTDVHYVYKNSFEGNYIELPLFNYKGYHAFDGKGTELPIRMSETNRIVVDMETGPDEAVIDLVFKVDPIFYDCAAVSLMATILLYGYIICEKCRRV